MIVPYSDTIINLQVDHTEPSETNNEALSDMAGIEAVSAGS